MYKSGKGVKKSLKKAFYYYNMAANQQIAIAYKNLGQFYKMGWGVKKSIEKSCIYYTKYFEDCRNQADLGCKASQYLTGECYENGIGVKKSPEFAFFYYNLSVQQNYQYAYYAIAKCYEKGFGIKKSVENAEKFYKKCLEDWDMTSGAYDHVQYRLACLLIEEKKDISLALKYLEKLLNNDGPYSTLSEIYLAEYYELENNKDSKEQSLYYYLSAGKKGSCIALSKLGDVYLYGELGLEKDFEKAFYYYQLSASQNDSYAFSQLSYCYEKGYGVGQSFEKARYYKELSEDFDTEISLEKFYKKKILFISDHKPIRKIKKIACEYFSHINLNDGICVYYKLANDENSK